MKLRSRIKGEKVLMYLAVVAERLILFKDCVIQIDLLSQMAKAYVIIVIRTSSSFSYKDTT